MTFVGLDLHKRYITACAIDEDGTPGGDVRRLSVTLEVVLRFLAELPQPVGVAIEATLYWAWLHDHLVGAGYRVQVAHAFQAKLIWQARSKTDPIDARKLAELLRAKLLPSIWVPDARTRALRQLLRSRAFLVRQRTQVKNRIHGHLTSENQLFGQTDLYGRAGRAWLAQVALSPVLQSEVQRLLRLHDILTTEIQTLDAQVKSAARHHTIAQQLHTIPGVGVFGALFLVAEIGTIERFRSSHELAAYAGLVPSTRSSGGKTTHGSVGHASNRWLKWILIEIVTTLKLAPGPVGQHYRHLVRAKGKSKAATAAARKLCCYIYWMLKEGWSYEEWLQQHGQSRWSEVRPSQLLGTMA